MTTKAIPLALLGLLLARAPFLCAQQGDRGETVRDTVLENGLRVIVTSNPSVPLATVMLAVRGGAITQDSGQDGMAHLFEHLIFRSFHGDASAFAMEAGLLNGNYNGTTHEELVTYYLELPSNQASKGVKLLGQLVPEAKFQWKDLAAELPVVEDEIHRGEAEPRGQLAAQVDRRLWGRSYYRKDAGGDSTSLRSITIDALQADYQRYYVPNNSALIVTGDVKANDIFGAARSGFGKWKRAADPFVEHPVPEIAPLTQNATVIVSRSVDEVTFLVSFQGPSVTKDPTATYAADALFAVLDEPGSGFQHDLVDSGLFQSVSGGYLTLNHVGPIEFMGTTDPEHAREALVALLGEIDQLDILSDVTDDDLLAATRRRELERALELEDGSGAAPSLAWWWSVAGLDYYRSYAQRLDAQGLKDLRQFSTDYIVGHPRVLGILAPPATAKDLAAWLRQAGGQSPP
ncbi:MAG TPA: pitrilysin family protein [Gemmatimonadales bacterium]|jgi:zinc protease|nr:pitrilysin family protein [Gemmatimonadales bacterium]